MWQAILRYRDRVDRRFKSSLSQPHTNTRILNARIISEYSKTTEPTKMKPNVDITDHYDYANHEQEYVMCHKNRPFAVLLSPNLPTPTSSFIDHRLVQELGLKMNDERFSHK